MSIRVIFRYFIKCSLYAKKQKGKIALMVFCSFCNFAIGLILPILSRIIFDRVIPEKDFNLLILVSLGTVSLSITRQVIHTLFVFFDMLSTQYLTLQVRTDLYRRIHRMAISYFYRNKIGDLMARLNNDCNSFATFIKDTYTILISCIPIILLGMFMVFDTNWQVGMFTIIYLALYAVGFILFPERHHSIGKLYAEKVGELTSTMQEGLSAVHVVKTFNMEEKELKKLVDKSKEVIQTNIKLMWSLKKNSLVGVTTNIIGTTFLSFYCAFQVINGRMTIGDLIAVTAWVGLVSGPIFEICQQYLNIQSRLGSIERVLEILNIPEQRYEGMILPRVKGELVFENVTFNYENRDASVLENLCLRIRPGESLALVGESGAGKTTIVNLLLRLEEPQKGRILLDGHNITDLDLHWLRRNIGVVSQDTFLFNTLIKNNISYGLPDVSESQIFEVSKLTGVHDFVVKLPQAYETIVGERGVTLSGGQKQRIAIARALLKNSPILILDEAMSSIDSETEEAIQENLSKLMQDRTSIIISHRLATLKYADKIAVLAKGKILETGTHPELMKRNGPYRRLYEKQLLVESKYV